MRAVLSTPVPAPLPACCASSSRSSAVPQAVAVPACCAVHRCFLRLFRFPCNLFCLSIVLTRGGFEITSSTMAVGARVLRRRVALFVGLGLALLVPRGHARDGLESLLQSLIYSGNKTEIRAVPEPPGAWGLWGWHEAVVDTNVPACGGVLHKLLSADPTAKFLTGGAFNTVTNRMFLCETDANATARRKMLPAFAATLLSQFGVVTNFMFGQGKALKNTQGIAKWVVEASKVWLSIGTAGVPQHARGSFQFDVEYDPTTADAVRVLRMAQAVQQQVASIFQGHSPPDRPQIVWIIDFASMLPIPSSRVPCPDGSGTMLIGECMLHFVDALTVMDYRSFAMQECKHPPCDGMTAHAAPFLLSAASAGKKVSIGVETSCDLGTSYQYKISFCADTIQQCCSTSDPWQYFEDSLGNTTAFLKDVSAAVNAYPCAKGQLPTGVTDLWTGNVPDVAPFVVEDMMALSALAFGDSTNTCPPDPDWSQCL